MAFAVFLFLCNFGVIGTAGNYISAVLFGLFGLTAYIFPVMIFVAVAFGISNRGNTTAVWKLVAGVVLFLLAGMVIELITNQSLSENKYLISEIYTRCSTGKTGGGILAGSITYLVYHLLDVIGSVLLILVLSIVCLVIITEKSFLGGVT